MHIYTYIYIYIHKYICGQPAGRYGRAGGQGLLGKPCPFPRPCINPPTKRCVSTPKSCISQRNHVFE